MEPDNSEPTLRLCIWQLDHFSSNQLWDHLRHQLGNRAKFVVKVTQRRQQDGRRRFDVDLRRPTAWLIKQIKGMASHLHGLCKEEVAWTERAARLRARPVRPGHVAVSGITWNCHFVELKRDELRMLVEEEHPAFICLQETHLVEKDKLLYVPGMRVVEQRVGSHVGPVQGSGLAIAVSNSAQAHRLEKLCHPCILVVEAHIDGVRLTICCVYINPARRAADLKIVAKVLERLQECTTTVVVAGDWNCPASNVMRKLGLSSSVFSAVPFEGSDLTFKRNDVSESALDYYLLNFPVEGLKAVGLQRYAESDHIPAWLRFDIKGVKPVKPPIAPRLSRNRFEGLEDEVAAHHLWGDMNLVLPQDPMDVDVASATKVFFDISRKVQEELKLLAVPGTHRKKTWLTPRTVDAVVERRDFAQKLLRKGVASAADRMKMAQLRERARQLIREDKVVGWTTFMCKGMDARSENSSEWWDWLRSVSKYRLGQSRSFIHPVLGKDNTLHFASDEVLVRWTEFYAGLFEFDDTLPDDYSGWKERYPLPKMPRIKELNWCLTWREIVRAMKASKKWKAPGPSDMFSAWIFAAWEKDPGEVPRTEMGKCLFALLQALWVQGKIPQDLADALVVSIFKKGDRSNPGDYRGISLMETLLKLTTCVLANRLQEFVPLSPSQAGFRAGEECMAHVVALLELCKRRKIQGLSTYVVFLDIVKAFDSVDHEALLYKLHQKGIRGRALRFIRALYKSPTCRVKLGPGLIGALISILCGTRQGDSASPILFDIFIDDLPQFLGHGVSVRGLLVKIAALMFADDASGLAKSVMATARLLKRAERWAWLNGLAFGVAKCAAMAVNGDQQALHDARLTLMGQLLPIVECYQYLGFPFHRSLDNKEVVKVVGKKLLKLCDKLVPFFKNLSMPLAAKLDIFKGVVLATACNGGEVYGMCAEVVKPLQKTVNRLMGCILRGWGGRPPSAVLLVELAIEPIYVRGAKMRRRAYLKFPGVQSVVSSLLPYARSTLLPTWVSGTERWLKQYGKKVLDRTAADWSASLVSGKVTLAGRRYHDAEFVKTRGFIGRYLAKARALDKGMAALINLRAGGNRFAYDMAKKGWLEAYCKTHCPCCSMAVRETLAHVLLRCPAWAVQRAKFLADIIVEATGPQFSRAEICTVVLGGSARGFSLGKAWWRGVGGAPPMFLKVAGFLQAIRARRLHLVWQYDALE